MKVFRYIAVGVLYCLAQGCATPVKVKQALVSIDEAYAGNARLMEQYRELVESVNTRQEYWNQHVQQLAILNLALAWATTNPRGQEIGNEKYVEASSNILGKEIVQWVNENRLEGLPARRGKISEIFTPGRGNIEGLVQALPDLTRTIEKKVQADYAQIVQVDSTAFEDYQKNLAALQRINAMIKRYLDIDVTVKPQDVKEIAEAVRTLQ